MTALPAAEATTLKVALEPSAIGGHRDVTAVESGPRVRIKTYLVLGLLGILLFLWLWAFQAEGAVRHGPAGKSFGADWAMFLGAAQVLKQGGNPYDHTRLYRTESTLLYKQGLPITTLKPVVRVGNPPVFYWILQPLTGLRFQPVAYAWMGFLYLVSLAGFWILLSHLGWRHRLLPSGFFALMPQVVIGAFYGNVVNLVFAAIAVGIALLRRHPILAGVALSLAWLKPPVALPIVFLLLLFHPRERRRALIGFAAATIVGLAATLATSGWHSLVLWGHGLIGYSRDMAIQPDVASLAGLYVGWAPSNLRLVLEIAVLAAAAVITVREWLAWRHKEDVPLLAIAWLWLVWMLATPYAHFFDEMLLAFPLLALMGINGCRAATRLPATALYLAFGSLFFLSWSPHHIYLLPVMLAGIGYCLFRASRQRLILAT